MLRLASRLTSNDDGAALAPAGLRRRDHFAEQRFMLHSDVAVFVGRRAAQQHDIDRERLVAQPFLAIDGHQLDQIILGASALPSTALPRIDEGVQADLGDQAGAAAGHVARELRQHALRQGVGLDLVVCSTIGISEGESISALVMLRLIMPS